MFTISTLIWPQYLAVKVVNVSVAAYCRWKQKFKMVEGDTQLKHYSCVL